MEFRLFTYYLLLYRYAYRNVCIMYVHISMWEWIHMADHKFVNDQQIVYLFVWNIYLFKTKYWYGIQYLILKI